MKKIVIVFISCIVLYACNCQDRKKESTASDSSTSVTEKSASPNEQDLAPDEKKSEVISFGDAAAAISKLLTNPEPSLKNLADNSIGGIFCADKFFSSGSDASQGVLMWFCLNQTSQPTPYPKFFLSIEQIEQSQVNDSLRANRGVLQLPLTSYPYEGTEKDSASVRTFLEKFRDKPVCPTGLPAAFPNTTEQQTHINQYRGYLLNNISPNTRMVHNDMDWAYFQNNIDPTTNEKALTKLLTQNNNGVKYIRYFFGYHKGPRGKNTIRVILFPVDTNGRNITNGYIVQKSIPPVGVLSTRK